MKTNAMVIKEYGENVEFFKSEITLEELKEHQILIEVKATSINPVDNKIKKGMPIGPTLPAPLHGDVAGVITKIGSKVTKFNIGDEVFGIAGGLVNYNGASANHMIVNEDLIYHKPKNLSFSKAASLPLVFITAYEGLVEKAKVKKGDNVLVIGGTGGVGHQVIQLAKLLGANVTTTVSSREKGKIAKSLGADIIINRKEHEITEYLSIANLQEGFDIVYDTVGGANTDTLWDLLKINGQVITTTSMESHDLSPVMMKGLSLHVVFMLLPMLTNTDQIRHQNILKFLAKNVEEDRIKTLIDEKKFNLEDINEAHSYFESGKHIGKIVIENNQLI